MQFDLRFPLGLLFTVLGVILLVQGLLASPEALVTSLGLNVNLYWGLAQIGFGATMLLLVFLSSMRRRRLERTIEKSEP